jgi:class 3 adenylate cyclase/tetratricopeptide (TPR) repeat protein
MQTTGQSTLDTLLPYLPAPLVDRWASRPNQSPLWGHWLTGSLMHCDVTGFTAMSESLAQRGKEGAELMASVLNRYFDRMLEIADRWDGVQMKFGGDAMLLLFSGHDHAPRAAACGLEMQTAMAEFRRVSVGDETYRLRMRTGVHSGRFFSASVGQPDGVLHYILVGPDVNRTAAVEPAAAPGQVVVSAETAALLGPQCQLAPTTSRGVWRVRRTESLDMPEVRRVRPRAPSDVLRRYLMPPLAEGRLSGFTGEHRRVTALFINIFEVSRLLEARGDSETLAQLDAYVRMAISSLERYGGFLAGSDVAEEGDKLIALFGAPISQERDEACALHCALELQRGLQSSDLELSQRIGINSGFVFAGEIGSSRRREYTVIGDSVNLAARLMGAARLGQTLVSGATAERTGAEFDLRRLRPIRVKGKSAPVHVYRLEGTSAQPQQLETESASPLVGRAEEIDSLTKLARRAARGRCRWAYVSGGAGLGKSRLTGELAARLRSMGWRDVAAFCQSHTSSTPFAPWTGLLRALFDIEATDSPREAWGRVKAEIARVRPELEAFAPLVGELLSLPVDDDPLLQPLDAKTRRQRLTATIVDVLHATARDHPLLLTFEDAHWADGPSLEMLADVLNGGDSRLMVCITSRQEALPQELSRRRPSLHAQLREVPAEDARHLVASLADLSDREVEAIVARAQGNPLFLQELARSGAVHRGHLPETINDVMMARLDRLPNEEKTVLRLASVIGPSFELPILQTLLAGRGEQGAVEQALASLSRRGLTRAERDEPATYAFCHVMTQEVAYESLPYAQRRRLHRSVASHIEWERADELESVCDLLLHHYDLANDPAKTVQYAAMSGDRAAAVFASREAVDYYRRSLEASHKARGYEDPDRGLLLERLGDTLATAGRHREAADAFTEALAEWRRCGRRGRPRLGPWSSSATAREASLCRKVGVCCERRSQFDESLRWLDEAEEALPRRPGRVGSQVHTAKSMSLFRKGLYKEAIRWGRLGLALARRSGDRRQLAWAHQVLANPYIEQGALRQAIRHLRPAVRLTHELGDFPGQAMTNSNLAACYQLLGTLDGALYHYDVSLRADERLANRSHAAIVRNNIGEVLLTLGRIDEAMVHLENVVEAHRSGADVAAVAGLAQVNISRCRLAQGDLDTAEKHLRSGLRLLRRVGARGLLAEARLQLAELRLAQGRAEEARRESRLALARARALHARLLEARGQRLLGSAQAALGEAKAALVHLRASIALAQRIGANYEQARSLIALAGLRSGSDGRATKTARNALERATNILSRIGAERDLAEAKQLLARLKS